ncbi:hypothetical protein AVEN_103951-1 [Araneus ventricosus]|uniref:Uncharacterized protein n=1 Tax=Araneus ventricosus TaxID=182803 RepID=A0A4Y2Q8S7_ARAVE|nr:hypothetical protein AVEN_103951-1 [Araneus ventricosus]
MNNNCPSVSHREKSFILPSYGARPVVVYENVDQKSPDKNHPGKNRCPASEGSSSQPATPLHCFGSDIPIVLTSILGKDESLKGQDQESKPGDPISPIPGDECVLLYPSQCGILHYRPRTKPQEVYFHSCSLVISVRSFGPPSSPFSYIEVSTIGTSLPKQ